MVRIQVLLAAALLAVEVHAFPAPPRKGRRESETAAKHRAAAAPDVPRAQRDARGVLGGSQRANFEAPYTRSATSESELADLESEQAAMAASSESATAEAAAMEALAQAKTADEAAVQAKVAQSYDIFFLFKICCEFLRSFLSSHRYSAFLAYTILYSYGVRWLFS